MFDDLVVSSVVAKKTNKPWTVLLGAFVQAAIVLILVLIPLIYTEALPKGLLTTFLVAPAPPPPPPPPPPAAPTIKHVQHVIQQNKMVTPTVIPKKIEIIKEDAEPPEVAGVTGGVVGGVPGGQAGGVLGGIIGGTGTNMPPPPKAPTPSRIRVGGNVQLAARVHGENPVYPPIAKTAHIQGKVVLHAIIARDGSIQELQFQSGPALLMKSAMDAVRLWRYKPTLLNGEPVEVDTTITVDFTLNE